MTHQFEKYSELIVRLHDSVISLEQAASFLKLDELAGREWFELLRQKLMPQLQDDAFLIVAVVGGTNIGKSVVFNHLAGIRASSTSPLASGTKHPVCLVSPRFSEQHQLESVFSQFRLVEWKASDAALKEHAEHLLFWKESADLPDNLLILDTPDIDSDAEINWERADNIRRCADVLVAVLTQQKYNDAAVKKFFRLAAIEEKVVIVLFNQCEFPEDEPYWPIWLETFCDETGIDPEMIYLAGNDRAAAEENRLSFYQREWPIPPDGDSVSQSPNNLTRDLSTLKFHEIKVKTLRGALNHLVNGEAGVPGWLNQIKSQSGLFQDAAKRLSSDSVIRINDWPMLPNQLLVSEVRLWWRMRQEGWAKKVNGVYDTIGAGLTWPFRFARHQLHGPAEPPLDIYRHQEWTIILKVVEELLEKLTWMQESGSALLQPHFEKILAGKSRAKLLEDLHTAHYDVNLQEVLEETVDEVMLSFRVGSPEIYKFYKNLNTLSAAVRPMTSVVLFTLGWGPAGELVAPFVADAAVHAIAPVVADFTSGAVASVAGEQAVATAAGSSAGFLQAKFQKLQTTFITKRADWLTHYLKSNLLGSLPEDLDFASQLPQSEAYQAVEQIVEQLNKEL